MKFFDAIRQNEEEVKAGKVAPNTLMVDGSHFKAAGFKNGQIKLIDMITYSNLARWYVLDMDIDYQWLSIATGRATGTVKKHIKKLQILGLLDGYKVLDIKEDA